MKQLQMACVLFLFTAGFQQTLPAITAPVDGQMLQGQVEITGSLDPANFASGELSFAYASDPTGTWFLIQSIAVPSQGGVLASWDTAVLTDGEYRLRLRQFNTDGSTSDILVEGLQLQNDVPTPTPTLAPMTATAIPASPTPAMTTGEAILLPTRLPTAVSAVERPTPEPLPSNPASISTEAVYSVFRRGALLVLILAIALGAFFASRRS